ncbi:hypothetical protein SAMN00120144_1383 [Hymenobacter roseosalivarius DSM 11622]|uniref:Uncharacterized protein n=1 Tax=Hymenobacter roseosalivarius DSM 11622 TaxID=645990 RepID=A0A1W1V2X7_9BACT|nr:hypothetical protein [Hymenobacter roseosalivarius]SMB87640.1 hypothetical protein SAMN00120144_1383 [Hymenobacter roseosalivarius DSM 11622]
MEPLENPMSPADSLRLIQTMIHTAKQDLSDHSFELLLWGWLVFAAATSHYGLLKIGYDKPWLAWPVLMSLGTVAAFVNGARRGRRERVRTAQRDFMTFLWAGFGVLMLMLIGVGTVVGWKTAYPLIIALYGLGTFATGGALRFRPLIWGGAACWLLATVAFRVSFETQLLLVAAAVLVAYIVPGHLLKNQYHRGRTL